MVAVAADTAAPSLVSAATGGVKVPKVQQPFTWEELAKHNTRDNAYIAVRGKVYDVTNFISRHPGGEDTLLLAAGRDATQIFEMYHSFAVRDVLPKFQVGILVTNELPVFPESGRFYKDVKKLTEEHFKKTGKDSKNHAGVWVRYAGIYATLAAAYYAQFFVPFVVERTWLQILSAVVMGAACAQIGLNPLHDASHFAVTHNPMVWKILGATHDFLNGASYLVWMYQHMIGHHSYTNIAGADPDVMTADPDVRRIKPSQLWFTHYLHQHLFVPVLYGVLAVKTRIQDITILYSEGKNDNIRINPITTWHTTVFWAGKAFFVFYRVIVPLLAGFSIWKVTALLAIADAVSSYYLALVFQVNHVVTDVEWPVPDDRGVVNMDWAEMQVATTQDYAHSSKFWAIASGSLNFQAVHHILPNVCQHHYPAILPYVKACAKENNVKYIIKESFYEALMTHIQHLYEMGQKPAAKAA